LLSRSVLAYDNASLGTAQELIAREADQVRAFGERFLHSGFMRQTIFGCIQKRTGAKIHHERQIVLVRQPGEVLEGRFFGETDNLEIGLMCHEQDARAFGDCLLKISEAHAVGGADLEQFGTGLLHHIRDAEAAADLHQL